MVRRPEDCLVLIRDRLPAYITWGRFEANQARLTANRQLPATPGAVRNGPAVLAGRVRCGRCGRRMVVRYAGPRNAPSYTCPRGSADYAEPLCRGLSDGTALDELVTQELLAAVAPAALEASRAAAAGVERLTAHLGPARRERHGTATGLGPDEYRPMGLARRLGVSRDTVRGWVRRGRVTTRADADGHHVLWADADELRRLGQLPGLRPSWANKDRLATLRRPKPRPKPGETRPVEPR